MDEAGIANAEDVLRIGAGLSWPTLHLELEYAPRLTVVDIFGSGSSPLLSLHSGSAGLLIRQPRYTLRLTQTGMWGEPDFTQFAAVTSAQATQAAAPMQAPAMDPMANPPTPVRGASSAPTLNLLPSARTLHMAGEETAVDLSVVLARRWRSDTRASYGFAGGADDLARMFWPRQRRAELDQAVAFDWSRRDQLSTLLSGARIEVSNGYEYWLTSASEAWDTRLSATTGSQLGVGAAFHESTAPDGTSSTHWGPIGSANLTHMTSLSEARVRLQVGLAYAPEINVLLGTLQNRLQGTASAAAVKGHVTVDLILAASQTIPTSAPYAARLASVALDLQYKLSEWLGAELGGQLIQQKLTSVIASTGGMWLLYVGIIARAPEAKF